MLSVSNSKETRVQLSQARTYLSSSYYVFMTLVCMESLRMINSVGAFGILSAMAKDLGVSIDRAQMMMLTPFLFGLIFGQFFLGMLSDRFGRMAVFIQFLNFYAIGSLLCLVFTDDVSFTIFRLLTGFTAAISEVTVRSVLADFCDLKLGAKLFSKISGLSSIVIGLAPVVMGYLSTVLGWRSFFIVNAILCCFISALALNLVKQFDSKINLSALSWRSFRDNLKFTLASKTYLILSGFFVISSVIMQFSFSLLPMLIIEHFGLSPLFLSLTVGVFSGMIFWLSALTNSWLISRYSMLSIIRVAFLIGWLSSIVHMVLPMLPNGRFELCLFLIDFFVGLFAENIITLNLFVLATQSADTRVGNGFLSSLTIALYTIGMVLSGSFAAFVDLKIINIAYVLFCLFLTLSFCLFLLSVPTIRKKLQDE